MVHLAIDTLFRSIQGHSVTLDDIQTQSGSQSDHHSSLYGARLANWKQDQSETIKFQPHQLCQDKAELDPACKYAIYIYMTEIYNDKVYDLLDSSSPTKRTMLSLKTNPYTKEVYPANVKKVYVASFKEAIKVLETGLEMRVSHSTGCNETSSRSHAIITLEVKRACESMGQVFVSKLTIADLAGNERNKISKTEGSRFQESCAINKSLMLLGQCLQMQKADDKKKPCLNESSVFRSSKLNLLLLSNAFRHNTSQKSVMLVAMDPYGDLNSAAQVLRYSATAREIPETKYEATNKHGYYGYQISNGTFYPNHSRTNSRDPIMDESRYKRTPISRASSQSSVHSGETLNVENEDFGTNVQELVQDMSQLSFQDLKSGKMNEARLVLSYINELETQVSNLNQKCLDIEWEVRAELAEEYEKEATEASFRQMDTRVREGETAQRLATAKIDIMCKTVYEPQVDELKSRVTEMEQECEHLEQTNNEYRRQNDVLQEIIRRSGLLQKIQNSPLLDSGSRIRELEECENVPFDETGYLIQLLQNSSL